MSNHYYNEIVTIDSALKNPIEYPAVDFITTSNDPTISTYWYSLVSEGYQWVIDSAATRVAYDVQSGLNYVLDSSNKPFWTDEHSPLFYTNQNPAIIDVMTTNGQNILMLKFAQPATSSSFTVDRHIDQDLDEACELYFNWAHIASGAAGTGMRWDMPVYIKGVHNAVLQNQRYLINDTSFTNSYNNEWNSITDNMATTLYSLSSIVNLLDWGQMQHNPATSRVTVEDTSGAVIYPFASGDSTEMLIWLMQDLASYSYSTSLSGVTLTITGLEANKGYTIFVFNDQTAELLHQTTTTSDGLGQISNVNLGASFNKHLAVIVKPSS